MLLHRTVDQGESVLAPTLVRRLIATYVQTPTTAPKPVWLDSLTPRENRGPGGSSPRPQ
jgi:hypothetical protein